MIIQGSFGYKIGRKVRLMNVDDDADLLWQICVREIYVLIKKYGSIELLREKFENLLEAKNKPKPDVIQKCEVFTNFDKESENNDWIDLTRNCQHSFINILECGYFLNNGNENGLVFILDFNTNSVYFYNKIPEKYSNEKYSNEKYSKNKQVEIARASIEELMEFDDMPKKTLTEIVTEMKERHTRYKEKYKNINDELERLNNIINKATQLGNDQNIIDKAKRLKDDLEWSKKELNMSYRFFYNRLDALNLIDHHSTKCT